MTTDEKLQHFYDVAVGEAHNEAQQMIAEYQKLLESQLEDHKKAKDREVEVQLKAEADNASREVNKALSASQLALKRKWTKKQNGLKEKLFGEVKELLIGFMSTPEYNDYLEERIRGAAAFAQEDEVHIYLSPEDKPKLAALSDRTGISLELAPESFMGGIKATIPHKNILIDNSFLTAITNERADFTFEGGPTHE